MWTKKQVLVTSAADGTIRILPMRYNASHQRGWRCFLGPLAGDPAAIREETEPSFQGRSLFDALAMFRTTIEPAGGRLLHAMASRECWADRITHDRFCRRLSHGFPATELIDGFLTSNLPRPPPCKNNVIAMRRGGRRCRFTAIPMLYQNPVQGRRSTKAMPLYGLQVRRQSWQRAT